MHNVEVGKTRSVSGPCRDQFKSGSVEVWTGGVGSDRGDKTTGSGRTDVGALGQGEWMSSCVQVVKREGERGGGSQSGRDENREDAVERLHALRGRVLL